MLLIERKFKIYLFLFHICLFRCQIIDHCHLYTATDNFGFLQLTGLTDADKGALEYIVKAARIMDDIFHLQVVSVTSLVGEVM